MLRHKTSLSICKLLPSTLVKKMSLSTELSCSPWLGPLQTRALWALSRTMTTEELYLFLSNGISASVNATSPNQLMKTWDCLDFCRLLVFTQLARVHHSWTEECSKKFSPKTRVFLLCKYRPLIIKISFLSMLWLRSERSRLILDYWCGNRNYRIHRTICGFLPFSRAKFLRNLENHAVISCLRSNVSYISPTLVGESEAISVQKVESPDLVKANNPPVSSQSVNKDQEQVPVTLLLAHDASSFQKTALKSSWKEICHSSNPELLNVAILNGDIMLILPGAAGGRRPTWL